jgi:hypothetical protein
MPLKAFSTKTDEEAHKLFYSLFENEKAKRENLTTGAFFEEIVNAYANPKTQTVDNPELKKRIEELEKEVGERDEELTNYLESSKSEVDFINALREILNLDSVSDGDAIVAEIKATQHRAMLALKEMPALEENEIHFTIPELHLRLLKKTIERLSEKYGQTVTMKDVLLDIFVRYTVQQFAVWFYPFVINGDDDFKEITGKTQKELQQWLKMKQ